MENENKQRTLVTLKSALRKVTLGAVLVGGLLIPTAQAADNSAAHQTLEQRVQVVSEALRKKLSETDSAQAEGSANSDDQVVEGYQWGDWLNWGNWNNWRKWGNWNNWSNWGNWLNW